MKVREKYKCGRTMFWIIGINTCQSKTGGTRQKTTIRFKLNASWKNIVSRSSNFVSKLIQANLTKTVQLKLLIHFLNEIV